MTSIARSRPWRGLRTTATGLLVASPHSMATVSIACSSTIALRIDSRPTPSAAIRARHCDTARGLMSRIAIAANCGATRRRQ
jgi:hypothetical protein